MSVSANRLLLLAYLLALALFVDWYLKKRDEYYREYLAYKEFKLLLTNYQSRARAQLSEDWIRNRIGSLGLELQSVKLVSTGYEVLIKDVPGHTLAQLVYSLESEGVSLVKFRAVDNTGSALFRWRWS